MEKVVYESVEVDRCRGCKGIWFDMHEQEDLKSMPGSESIDIGDPSVGKKYNRVDRINCPVCEAPMIRMVDRHHPHIWYEACTLCYGVFFDAGEFSEYKSEGWLSFVRDLISPERP